MKFSSEDVERCRGGFQGLDVDALVARTEARLSIPGAKEITHPGSYLWSVCERAQDEGKFKRGHSRAQDVLPNAGFDEHGSVLRSQSTISNGPTRFARFLVSTIREQLLSPYDVILLLRAQDPASQRMFSPSTIGQWSVLDTIDGWGSASAGTSFEEYVRSWGNMYPWFKDAYLWAEIRERWAARQENAVGAGEHLQES